VTSKGTDWELIVPGSGDMLIAEVCDVEPRSAPSATASKNAQLLKVKIPKKILCALLPQPLAVPAPVCHLFASLSEQYLHLACTAIHIGCPGKSNDEASRPGMRPD
jgi:hypothetical protein